jgi:hypothetical protein
MHFVMQPATFESRGAIKANELARKFLDHPPRAMTTRIPRLLVPLRQVVLPQ